MAHPLHQHPLQRVDPKQVYAQYNGQWKCDNCGSSNGPDSLPHHCMICSYDICGKCYDGSMHPRHPHPLFLMSMDRVYPMYQGNWKCDHCKRSKAVIMQNFAYHCPRDDFDLCQECFQGRQHPIHIHRIKPADAILVYGPTTGLWICDSCKRTGREMNSQYPWHCSECEFDTCDYCMKDHAIFCHPHPLKITDCRLSYPQYNGGWKCDLCRRVGGLNIENMDKSFHCQTCEYDICQYCMRERAGWPRPVEVPMDEIPAPQHPPLVPVHFQHRPNHRPPFEVSFANSRPMPEVPLLPEDDEPAPNIDDSQRCIICMDRAKNATIVHGSTGHVCCCVRCAVTLQRRGDKCPICRANIDHVIRHYNS